MVEIVSREYLLGKKKLITPYTGPLLRPEKYLFHMPQDPEFFLAALAAVEGFINFRERENTNAAMNNQPWCHIASYATYRDEFAFMIPDFLRRPIDIASVDDWDLEICLDPDRAASLIQANEYSITEGFAVMMGAELLTHFPPSLSVGDLSGADGEVLIFADALLNPLLPDLCHLLSINFEYLDVTVLPKNFQSLEDRFALIANAAAVIGMQSAETYYACCRKRLTIEISLDRSRNFMSKWQHPYYALIQASSSNPISPTFIYRAFKNKAESMNLKARIK